MRRLKATSGTNVYQAGACSGLEDTVHEVLHRQPSAPLPTAPSASSDAMVRLALSRNYQAGACRGVDSTTARPPTCTPPPTGRSA
eukprot:9494479-Pyramimonas_sp.AAC.1